MGQRQDPTAMAVVERWEEDLGQDWVEWRRRSARRYAVRHLERAPLNTLYADVVERVRGLTERLRGGGAFPWDAVRGDGDARCALAVDATGVGWPVVELIRSAGLGCEVTAVVITGGDREGRGDGMARVPKRDLVMGLQVLLETGALKVAAGLDEGEALVREMSAMRVKITPGRHEQFAAWREGAHDDLVLAVALACWRAKKVEVGEKGDGRVV